MELRKLAEIYLTTTVCAGNHLVHSGYVCPWCDSDDPSGVCHKEKVRRKRVRPNDYKPSIAGYTEVV